MTTWRDVERVHVKHPDWPASRIAKSLRCGSAYVRATANRRGWDVPNERNSAKNARVIVPISQVLPFCLPNERPHRALKRIVRDALAKARAA